MLVKKYKKTNTIQLVVGLFYKPNFGYLFFKNKKQKP